MKSLLLITGGDGIRRRSSGLDFRGVADVRAYVDRSQFRHKLLILRPTTPVTECMAVLGTGADVIFNCLADPDINPITLGILEEASTRLMLPVLNRPGAVRRSRRDDVAAALAAVPGLIMPRTVRLTASSSATALEAEIAAAGLRWPLLVRPTAQHGGGKLGLLRQPATLPRVIEQLGGRDLYFTEFHDFHGRDRLYRKFRFFVFGGESVVARHMIAAPSWNIHARSRRLLMSSRPDLRAEEELFVNHFPRMLRTDTLRSLGAIGRALNLDYVGVDCAIMRDGRVLVFEANPCMALKSFKDPLYDYLDPTLDSVRDAFARLLSANSRALSPYAGSAA